MDEMDFPPKFDKFFLPIAEFLGSIYGI